MTANLKVDGPVSLGSVAGSIAVNPITKKVTDSLIVRKGVIGSTLGDSNIRPSKISTGAGGLIEGLGAGLGEAAGAALGNELEAQGIPTNLRLTDSEGKLAIGLAFSNRNPCNGDDEG